MEEIMKKIRMVKMLRYLIIAAAGLFILIFLLSIYYSRHDWELMFKSDAVTIYKCTICGEERWILNDNN